jgi:hypothetical protein
MSKLVTPRLPVNVLSAPDDDLEGDDFTPPVTPPVTPKQPKRLVNLKRVECNSVAQKQRDELPNLAAVELSRDDDRRIVFIDERPACCSWAKAWNRDELDLHKATGYRARVVKIRYMIEADQAPISEGGAS